MVFVINPLTFGPFSDPTGDFMTQLVDVNPRAVVQQIRMLRGGNGPGVELFQYTSPDQDQTFRANSDWGGHHVTFYVRDIDKGVEYLQTKAGTKLFGPVTLTDGPAAVATLVAAPPTPAAATPAAPPMPPSPPKPATSVPLRASPVSPE